MLMDLLLKPFSSLVNALCRCDECFFPRLQPFIGTVIRLQSRTGWCSCDCVIQDNHFSFYQKSQFEPDITLILTPTFIKDWLCDPKNPLVFFSSAYEIHGDMSLAEEIKAVFATLDIDAEEQLAKVIGDPLAVNFGYCAGELSDWARSTKQQCQDNFRDYLQEETQLLITPGHVVEFIQQTHILRDDVERLSARIQRLETRIGS